MVSAFNEEDIRQLAALIRALDRSTFDYLQLEVGGIKITLGKGDAPVPDPRYSPPAQPAAQTSVTAEEAPAVAPSRAEARTDGSMTVAAPIMGVFYSKPDPGSPPFVTVGAKVAADDTVGLIEVMKIFNAVRAAVAGTIIEICVEDGQFVEFGQVLFRVQPAEAAPAGGARAEQGRT